MFNFEMVVFLSFPHYFTFFLIEDMNFYLFIFFVQFSAAELEAAYRWGKHGGLFHHLGEQDLMRDAGSRCRPGGLSSVALIWLPTSYVCRSGPLLGISLASSSAAAQGAGHKYS